MSLLLRKLGLYCLGKNIVLPVISGLLFLSSSLNAIAFTENDYEVLYGDFNNDGNSNDIYFHRLDTFVLIHGEISIPLLLAEEGSYVVYEGSSSAVVMKARRSEFTNYTVGVAGVDFFVEDEDGDGDLDLSAHDRENNRVITLLFSSTMIPTVNIMSTQPIVQSFSYDAMGRLRDVKKDGVVKQSLRYDRAGNRCEVSSTQSVAEAYCENNSSSGGGSSTSSSSSSSGGVTNSPPVAESIFMDGLPSGQAQTVSVVSGSDPDGDTLVYISVSQPSQGSAQLLSPTSIRIIPYGTSSFTFTISDGKGGTDTGTISWTTACYNPNGC